MEPVLGSAQGRQIAFVGPFAVGKTTAVGSISASKVVMTEARSTVSALAGRHVKPTSTVGLEYGDWQAPDGTVLAVVGTPGQARFDAVRRSAMPRSRAVVLWLFGHHREALLDAGLWTEFVLSEGVPSRKLTVAVTRLQDGAPPLPDFAQAVAQSAGAVVPVLAADPRVRDDVDDVLLASLRGDLGAGAAPDEEGPRWKAGS